MWIVTRSINEYDQYGNYFVCAFDHKPTFQELKNTLWLNDITTGKLTRGGGRQSNEYEWYYLTEINNGEIYEEK